MTICSYDNSGQIKFDVDIEMEQGYWNTSTSRLWTKIRDWMHDDLVAVYKDLRQNGLSYETLMKYFYDEQIAKIPQTYYNNDCDVKYIPYANEYIGKAHGDGYEHLKRWLKRRIIFCDTLFDYSPSYTNDVLTIRANTTETMTLEIETYTPVYQHLSWYNNQMDKKKIDGKTSVVFTGNAQASTDQEVLIYGGSNIKSIKGISTMNPNQMLIGSATRLTELEATNCPLLTDINSNKANLSPHTYLNKVDLSGCGQLGGALRLNNSPLIRDINMKGTVITSVQMPTSVRNLEVLRLPNTITSLTLQDASLLNTLEFDEGMALQSISLTNCNNLTNAINFDLTKTPTVYLDNSYNAEELYMSNTTNLTLRNMSNLERVIYTPNDEYETFDMNSIINGSNYKITTFNNPLMTEFIITAPHRVSYKNGEYGYITPNTVFSANTLDLSDTQFINVKFLCTTDLYNLKVPITMKNFYCDSTMDIDTEVITDANYEVIHDELIEQYTTDFSKNVYMYKNVTIQSSSGSAFILEKILNSDGSIVDSTSSVGVTDYLLCSEGSECYMSSIQTYMCRIAFYDSNKSFISIVEADGAVTTTAPIGTTYVVFYSVVASSSLSQTMRYQKGYTPNIIPSSASGSLIFNMYSNNTTQPTSTSPYMWDLTGLKLNDFYTYGMNNWVKPSDDSIVLLNRNEELTYCYGTYSANNTTKGALYTSTGLTNKSLGWLRIPKGNHIMRTSNGTNVTPCWWDDTNGMMRTPGFAYIDGQSYNWNDTRVTTDYYDCYLAINNQAEWIMIDDIKFDLTSISDKGIDGATNDTVIISDLGDLVIYDEGCDVILDGTPTSITMPQRLPGYSVRMVNADIAPNNYANHLYPLLVDTTLPITGRLDYSTYNGTSLAWAYAYTTNDVAITPLGSQNQGKITNDYNKLYGTDYVDIADIWAYKDDDFSGRNINEQITEAYIELTSTNYKSRIDEVLQWYPNCTDLYLFEDGSMTTLDNLIHDGNTTYKNQFKHITFMEGYFNNVTSAKQIFQGSSNLITVTNLPNNITTLWYAFAGCASLTTAPTIPNGVTNMTNTFNGCTSLTTPPTIPDGVTTMYNTFNGCASLTTAPTIPNSVTDMRYTFYGCKSLVNPPIIPYGVIEMYHTFYDCTSLVSMGDIPDSVTNLGYTFYNCTSLKTIGTLSSNLTQLLGTFRGCTSLEIAPSIPNGIINLEACFRDCSGITDWTNIINNPLSNVTNLRETFYGTSAPASIINNKTFTNCNFYASFSYSFIETFVTENVTLYNCTNFTRFMSASNVNKTIDLSGITSDSPISFYEAFWGNYGTKPLERVIFPSCQVSNCTSLFSFLTNLTTVDMSNVDASICTDWLNAFSKCSGLTTFNPPSNISASLDLSSCILLEETYVHQVITNLATVESATLTLGETLLAYLTEDELTSATNKGWTLQ